MTQSIYSELPLRELLGPIKCPEGSDGNSPSRFRDFGESLAVGHRSVMRSHRLVSPESLPFSWEPVAWFAKGHRLIRSDDHPSKSLSYAGADYFLQDAASLLAIALCFGSQASLDGKVVCDLCAAPGGKASALLEAVGQEGFLLANEPIRSRISVLRYSLARTGSDRYAISSLDPEQLAKHLPGEFDCVLVDAPCSGQALFGRGKQSQAAFSSKQIEHNAKRQARILDAAIVLLKPGGRLVYSTCTFAYAENEAQIERLAHRHRMIPEPIGCDVPNSEFLSLENRMAIESLQTTRGCYRLWPHRHPCAGSFAASMVRGDMPSASSSSGDLSTHWSKRKRKSRRTPSSNAKFPADLDAFFERRTFERLPMIVTNRNVFCFPSDAPTWVSGREKRGLQLTGSEIAYCTGKTWKPSHEASLRRREARIARHSVPVDEAQAIEFMSGQPLRLDQGSDLGDTPTGWAIAEYQGRLLGWLKCSGFLGKNHLPVPFRLNGIEKSPSSA